MWLLTVLLLLISNVFMTLAWYGHLKFKTTALWLAIVVSWMIALAEYCFQVPANRIGHNAGIAAAQLKTIQEVITLVVFCLFSVWYLREPMRWTYLVGFVLIASGALFVFAPWQEPAKHAPRPAAVQPTESPAVVVAVPAGPAGRAEVGHENTDVATAG